MDDLLRDPFAHAGAAHLCPACEAPEIPGLGCFCSEPDTAGLCCPECGAGPDDYGATCPTCRESGRVDSALDDFVARYLGAPLPERYRPLPLPLAEEPLPTEPPKRGSWRPRAA